VRSLYERVLAAPEDATGWRELAEGFARSGRVGRAVACLDALEATESAPAAHPGDRELRRAAGRIGVEQRKTLFAALAEPDDHHVSVVVVGEPGVPATERTLASLSAVASSAGACRVIVSSDRSEGLARARGRYVAHVDAGDELWADHLPVLADHLDHTGRAMTYSRGLRPASGGAFATDGAPVLPRQAAHDEFVPSSCVLHRRRDLLRTGGFDPALGRGQAWHLWRRFVERLGSDSVPVLSALVCCDDVSPERRFDLLLVRRGAMARARRWHRKARRQIARGDARLATHDLTRAWNLGLEVAPFVSGVAAVAQRSPRLAADLVALGAGEVEPCLRGRFQRIARGAEARRQLAIRTHRQALRTRYREADRRGRDQARRLGWCDAD